MCKAVSNVKNTFYCIPCQDSKKHTVVIVFLKKCNIYDFKKYLAPLWTGLLADGAMYVVGLLFSWRQRCHYRQLSDDMNNII